MVVKLNSLTRWALLPEKNAIAFEGTPDGERRVRINFNLEGVTAFFIGDESGEKFLCTIGPGLETVEFNASGCFNVYPEDGSGVVHYQSADLEPTFHEVLDPVIFTRIAQRRHRNPELEEIMYRMQANVERRLASQADEMQAFYAQKLQEADNARAAQNNAGTSSGAGGDEVWPQSPAGEKPGETPVGGATGEQKGGSGDGSTGATKPA